MTTQPQLDLPPGYSWFRCSAMKRPVRWVAAPGLRQAVRRACPDAVDVLVYSTLSTRSGPAAALCIHAEKEDLVVEPAHAVEEDLVDFTEWPSPPSSPTLQLALSFESLVAFEPTLGKIRRW